MTAGRTARITIATVAQEAGVSVSTASAALSGTGRVGPQTAELVRRVARELGYRVNPSARALRTSGNPVVGVVVDVAAMNLASNQNPALWWPRAIFSLVDALGDAGVSVHLVSARTEVNWSSIGVDALITIERPGGHSVIPNSIPFGIPIFYGGDLTDDVPGVARIAPDYRAVATLGLDHLEDSGSRRPGLLSLAARVSFAEHLEQGYESWCASRGIEPLIVGRNGGAPALLVEELLAKGCDGILSLSNASAEILAGLTSIAQVPQECRLLVLSEGLVERHLSPRVSVLSLDGASAGRRVAARVIEALSTGRAEPIELSATLLIGETT